MVAVIGRRRVGKTFLVRSVYAGQIVFEVIGLQKGNRVAQLQNFVDSINQHAKPTVLYKRPKTWLAAFQLLIAYLETLPKDKKHVLFFDELPWLAGNRNDFLQAFGLFWNSWASQQNIVVVICGSAASWMITKVMRDKGGLHNRVTKRIILQPFNLAETEAFLLSRGVKLNRYQILQITMALGGIPQYLREVEPGLTANENIDRICFGAHAMLRDEFNELYVALFEHADSHIRIVQVLGARWQGMSRIEIAQATGLAEGGNLSKYLEELMHSGFIQSYYAFGKQKKDMRYRLIDEYSLFFLHFIDGKRAEGSGTWHKLSQTQLWKSWSGYAFENICLKHVSNIKKCLGISGIYTEASGFYVAATERHGGVQIDLLIDRNDQAINLIEIKFYNDSFSLSKQQADEIRTKRSRFQAITGTKKQVFNTLLTTFPLQVNEHSLDVLDQKIPMDCLFE
jgi:uncharacterized protein